MPNLRYADDTLLIAGGEAKLLMLLNRLENISREYDLMINYNKTTVMIIDRENEGRRQPTKIGNCKGVDQFVYLGSLLHNSGNCEHEIRRRIVLACSAMTQLTKIWRDRKLTRTTKIGIVNALVFPIFSYVSETLVI